LWIIAKVRVAGQKGSDEFVIVEFGNLRFRGRLCVPQDGELRETILQESHSDKFFVHPVETKMYCELRELYW
jgi:hypothetical protein